MKNQCKPILSYPIACQEKILSGLVVLALLAAGLLPFIAQDQAYHQFADRRIFFNVPNTLDSLSNLAFVIFGAWGLVLQWRRLLVFETGALQQLVTLFFVGFIGTGVGSFWYHLAPDDTGLVLDRLGMVIALSGVLGIAAAHKVSARAGYALAALALALGPLSVWWWKQSGNVAPYAVLQFGGMLLVIWMMSLRSSVRGPNWAVFITLYALAKVFETFDLQVFQLTHGLISGHTLKHLVAACAALAIIFPKKSHKNF